MSLRRAIVWFRQDLRLHDNEAITNALKMADEVLPVYVFDERIFRGRTRCFDFPKTGKFRAKFIIEAVEDLREQLRARGNELVVRIGKPEEVIFELARECRSNWVFCNRERTTEEVAVQNTLEKNLWSIGQEVLYTRGKMLYYTADLPFPVTHSPDVFTQFRKEVERIVPVREPLPSPKHIPHFSSDIVPGLIPTLQDFGHDEVVPDSRSVIPFQGGETAALDRLHYYLWETDHIKEYKETRNGLIGGDYSTKFSAWLAQGCLSPKKIYHELKKYEAERGANKSTYWLFFELLWRDFFRLMGKKYGEKIFLKGGTKREEPSNLRNNWQNMRPWLEGETGVPFIDANMRELNLTGFMSNRGRQNVASFLVKDLFVNWQMGAEYFESMLIDYDVTSNWGNWNYIAGVGSDPREDRYFNIVKQARRYDPKGNYVKLWVPELAELPADMVHIPDQLKFVEQEEHHVEIGKDYPQAIVETKKWD
ncbi:MAG: DASH family cryptochrome [Lewinella sp.]|jgi:deoxyribodipyrimidine photo-lyase|uniref:DASH family cryptochrome n=1 Tax=Lewinella sp. TaxID=2004506 RepID=UPI003D6B8A12